MRKLARYVAKENMKKKGVRRPCKCVGLRSYFSKRWREFV